MLNKDPGVALHPGGWALGCSGAHILWAQTRIRHCGWQSVQVLQQLFTEPRITVLVDNGLSLSHQELGEEGAARLQDICEQGRIVSSQTHWAG